MNKKPQFFIIANLATQVKEYRYEPSLRSRAGEIKEKYNYNFPLLRKAV